MKVLVSACLLGTNCKYNGENNYSEKVMELIKDKEVIPVCPEVTGGLPTPRTPSEIVNGVVTSKSGQVVDKEFRLGAKRILESIHPDEIEFAVLQARSPSCGSRQIYDGTFSGTLIEGQGIFAKALSDLDIPIIDSEDCDRFLSKHV